MGIIEALSPVDGTVIGQFKEAGEEAVQRAVQRARDAQQDWGALPVRVRCRQLARLRRTIGQNLDRVVAELTSATGKAEAEILASDVLVSLDIMRYYEREAPCILGRDRRRSPGLWVGCRSWVEYHPLGVVAVLSPWNYPLQLALVPLATALFAGNAVVLKPSEVVPTVGELIAELCSEARLPDGLVQVVQGGSSTGAALCRAGVDKIFFTGSVATGKKVMAAAAETMTPVELELGGKDPMIVFADAPFTRAVRGAVWGAFSNTGQACVSVERCYVERSLYDRFVGEVADEVSALRLGSGAGHDLGPMINPLQVQVVERHLADALERGARAVLQPRVEGNRVWPVVLADVDHTMAVMTEETFGPLLPIMPFDDEDEAVRLANDSIYGLSASVWSGDLARARRVTSRLQTGNCAINDTVKNIGNPYLPFGGAKQSGLGRYHGPEGLHSFSVPCAVMENRNPLPREINWFPYSGALERTLRLVLGGLHGGGPAAIWRNLRGGGE